MIVAVDLNGGTYHDCQRVLSVSFCGHNVERILVELRAVAVRGRHLEACLRLIRNAVRHRRAHVRGVSLVSFFKDGGTRDPDRDVPLCLFARHLTFLIYRLFTVVRIEILVVKEGGRYYDVSTAGRAASTHLVTTHLGRVLVVVAFWRVLVCLEEWVGLEEQANSLSA